MAVDRGLALHKMIRLLVLGLGGVWWFFVFFLLRWSRGSDLLGGGFNSTFFLFTPNLVEMESNSTSDERWFNHQPVGRIPGEIFVCSKLGQFGMMS